MEPARKRIGLYNVLSLFILFGAGFRSPAQQTGVDPLPDAFAYHNAPSLWGLIPLDWFNCPAPPGLPANNLAGLEYMISYLGYALSSGLFILRALFVQLMCLLLNVGQLGLNTAFFIFNTMLVGANWAVRLFYEALLLLVDIAGRALALLNTLSAPELDFDGWSLSFFDFLNDLTDRIFAFFNNLADLFFSLLNSLTDLLFSLLNSLATLLSGLLTWIWAALMQVLNLLGLLWDFFSFIVLVLISLIGFAGRLGTRTAEITRTITTGEIAPPTQLSSTHPVYEAVRGVSEGILGSWAGWIYTLFVVPLIYLGFFLWLARFFSSSDAGE